MSPIFKKASDTPSPSPNLLSTKALLGPLDIAKRALEDARTARDELEAKFTVAAQAVTKLEREFRELFTRTTHPGT